jgi:hypothetical protein
MISKKLIFREGSTYFETNICYFTIFWTSFRSLVWRK